MSHDIANILADPSAYGFEWSNDEMVKRDGMKYTGNSLVNVTNIPLFDKSFPGVLLATSNGQSVKVNAQRITRDARAKGIKDVEQIKARQIRWLLGLEQSAPRFAAADGNLYETKEAAESASIEWALAQVK